MASSLFQNNNGLFGLIQQFNDFKKQIGDGDPQKIVQQLLDSGRMTKEQYQQLSEMANQFRSILK